MFGPFLLDGERKMSLAERLKTERPDYRPTFTEWFMKLAPADKAALEEAAKDPAWSNAALVRIIQDEGGVASKDTIAKWRVGVGR
jgi:hypothetical protein